MTKHLLRKTILTASIAILLGGCGSGTDEGYDPGFNSSAPLVIAMPAISATATEESGIIEINLKEGVTVDGQALTGTVNISDMIFTVDQNYLTPQTPANGEIQNQTISPFIVKDGLLVIDTDGFADRLSTCDDTDLRGGPRDANDNPTPDGFLDNPPQVTYSIDFAIDNGFPLTPGTLPLRRVLTLTVDAIFDDVVDITAAPVRVSLDDEAVLFATVLPEKACNKALTFEMADESIATIDDSGLITPVSTGTTSVTVTSVSNPDLAITVDVEVFSEFTLTLPTKTILANGLPADVTLIPSCTSAGIRVSPIAAAGEMLNGDYEYVWASDNDVDFPVVDQYNYGEEGIGRFSVGDNDRVGFEFMASVVLDSGDTGTTPIESVASQDIALRIAQNEMCAQPDKASNGATWGTDFNMDGEALPPPANWVLGPPGSASGGSVDVVPEALSGNSIQITAGNGDVTSIMQPFFNKLRHWFSVKYGQGAVSIGLTQKPTIWVKLDKVPTSDVVLSHRAFAWVYQDGPSGPGFDLRYPTSQLMSATLIPTTEWQYVEFKSANGRDTWTVPNSWNISTQVFIVFEVEGLPEGDKINLDEYAVMQVQ